MARAERHDGFIIVATNYTDRDLMTQIPGSRYQNDGTWKLPLSWASCLALRGVFGSRLEVGPALAQWSWQTHTERIGPVLQIREALELSPDDEVAKALDSVESVADRHLKSFQRAGVAFLVKSEQALLCDTMGTGKTAQSIRVLQVLHALGKKPYPALIVCPNSLKFSVWETELQLWAPELTVSVCGNGSGQVRKDLARPAHVYVIHWDALRTHSRQAGYGNLSLTEKERLDKELNRLPIRTAIFDEAHRLKDPKTAQTRSAWAVAHAAHFRFALTGTPVADHVGDLWGLLHAILPDWFPAKTRYMERYALLTYNLGGGSEVIGLRPDTEPEFRSIVTPLWRRVPKELVLPQLPPIQPVQYRSTPMTPKQAKLYKQMEDEQLAWVGESEDEALVAPTQLAKLTRLLQFAAASAELEPDGTVRLSAPSCKVNDLADLLEEMGDDPLVVVAVSRQLIELAAKKLHDLGVSYGLVTGAQSPEERQQAVKMFQSGTTRVILLTLGAGAEGLTLTRSDTILFMQESWRQLENEQAIGRIDRIGAEGHVSLKVIKQITPGTVEERKVNVLQGKTERIEEILRDRDTLRRLLGSEGDQGEDGQASTPRRRRRAPEVSGG